MTSPPPRSPSISRYFAIVMAFGVAAFQATRAHWFEVFGLVGLGMGLILLRLAQPAHASALEPASSRRMLRWMAMACFLATAAAVVHVLRRDY
jgi:hypothetical protein